MTLANWAARRDPSVDRAKQKLATMRISETGHGAKVPWPFQDRSIIKSKHTNREINDAIRKAPIVSMDLDDDALCSLQHSVKAPHVSFYLEHPDARQEGHLNPKSKTPDDYPIVIQQDGKKVLWDGNHRMTALYLLGRDKAEVRFVNFDT